MMGLLVLGLGAWMPDLGAATEPVGLDRYEYRRVVFGVEARLVMYTTDEKTAAAAAEGAWRRFEELDAVLSNWRVDSELSLLVGSPAGEPLPVSEDLFEVLSTADRLYDVTEGCFDVSVGPLMKLWQKSRTWNKVPAEEDLLSAAERVGWDKITLLPGVGENARGGTLVFSVPGMVLDLGGLAKGYGAQQALAAMKLLGVSRAVVEVGGDIAAGDPPPDREDWDMLAGCGPGRVGRVGLLRESLAVSGDTEQFMEVDGVRFSHVLDPRTGRAVTQRVCATVVAQDGATADALASAVQVLGMREGRRVVQAVSGARLVHVERLDQPVASRYRDPLRVAPPLDVDFGKGETWSEEDGILVGRLHGEMSPMASFPGAAKWSLEMNLSGDGGADLLVHPDLDQPGEGAVRLGVSRGAESHWEVHCDGFDRWIQVWCDGAWVRDVRLPSRFGSLNRPQNIGLSLVASRAAPLSQEDSKAERVAHAATRSPLGGVVRLGRLQLRQDDPADDRRVRDEGGGRLALTEEAKAEGWESLIDLGMSQWEEQQGEQFQDPVEYIVTDGILHIPAGGSGHLQTKKDYTDFRLRMDFKLTPGANSGLFLRGERGGGDPAYTGCEVQIIDDHGWEKLAGFPLKPRQRCGSLYAAVAADTPDALRPTGEWNTYEVLFVGSRLAVALNGQVLYDVDTLTLECKPPFAERVPAGFLGLQRYGAPHVEGDTVAWVRNMFVQPLSPEMSPEKKDVGQEASPADLEVVPEPLSPPEQDG